MNSSLQITDHYIRQLSRMVRLDCKTCFWGRIGMCSIDQRRHRVTYHCLLVLYIQSYKLFPVQTMTNFPGWWSRYPTIYQGHWLRTQMVAPRKLTRLRMPRKPNFCAQVCVMWYDVMKRLQERQDETVMSVKTDRYSNSIHNWDETNLEERAWEPKHSGINRRQSV
jgi:hypothetical protein